MRPTYIIGLDLGQTTDPSAMAVLERTAARDSRGGLCWRYGCRHLHRWPLGMPYTARPGQPGGVVEDVAALCATPPLPGCDLAVDQTGVGRAVVDLLTRANPKARLVPVTITAGAQAAQAEDGRSWHVPKRDLVGVLQALLGTGRLQIASSLPLAAVLERELANFRVKVTAAANETYAAWREGDHDDLVLAVAVAAWLGERCPPLGPDSIGTPKEKSVFLGGESDAGPSPFGERRPRGGW